MTRIDTSQALVALIQQGLTGRSNGVVRGTAGTTAGSVSEQSGRPFTHYCRDDISATVSQRIRAIDTADPDRRRKAFRFFLEATLAAELGGELIDDPAFYRLVDEVQESMNQDTSLQPALIRATDELLLRAGTG